MLRPLAIFLLLATPALAAQNPSAASLYHQQDARAIAIQNWSSQTVVAARVQTTDGKIWNLAKGEISSNQAKEVVVPARDCIANITVKLQNGHTLSDNGLHECSNTKIVVRDEGISIPQQAVPGAQQHGTPG